MGLSLSVSAQVSPRILSAFDRLDKAVQHLERVCESQKTKVDAAQVELLQNQVAGLQQDNLALSEALEAYSEADYDTQFDELKEKIADLENDNQTLNQQNETLSDIKSDFSERLEKLIGNVQQVLDEGEDA
jgi:DNA repair exonuclease SbcCD ATPase subunit